eukprot:768330-Hanusia_phi.AAC.1
MIGEEGAICMQGGRREGEGSGGKGEEREEGGRRGEERRRAEEGVSSVKGEEAEEGWGGRRRSCLTCSQRHDQVPDRRQQAGHPQEKSLSSPRDKSAGANAAGEIL